MTLKGGCATHLSIHGAAPFSVSPDGCARRPPEFICPPLEIDPMPSRTLAALLFASALVALPASPQSPAHDLVNGKHWQSSTVQERRAYLIGVSNVISVGARVDTRQGREDTFSLHAQKGLDGTRLDAAISAIDAWYSAHPGELDKPVLSVIWRELAKREPVG
jgi:hypothetical protein